MTPLRQRMLEDMQARLLSPSTQRTYIWAVARFARHFGRSPARLGPEEVRAYQVHLAEERRLARSSLIVNVSALRFLYRITLKKPWPFRDLIPLPKKDRSLPVVLSPDEVVQFSRRGEDRQAPRHPDDLLRRRPAHLRGHPPHRVRDRQRTHGAARRERQGPEGPLRDALAEVADCPPRLVAGRAPAALALSGGPPGDADHAGSGVPRLPTRRPTRTPHQAGLPTRPFVTLSPFIYWRPAPTCARFNSCSATAACRRPPGTCRSRRPRSVRP